MTMWLPTLSAFILVSILAQDAFGQNRAAGSISDAMNAFSLNFLAAVSSEADSSLNLAVSPYTAWTLLSIIAEGAQGNTLRELETVLNLPRDKVRFRNDYANLSNTLTRLTHGVELDISNAIFTTTDQKLYPSFRQATKKYYGVDVTPTNFKDPNVATKMINLYVAKATRNLIQNFITPDDLTDAQIFLTSALYFKGQWTTPFNRSATHRSSFYDEKMREQTKVEMMYQIGYFPYSRLDALRSLAVELPYGSEEKMSMIVILPYKDETLNNVLNKLSKLPFSHILDRLTKSREEYIDDEVEVYLPKFAVNSDLNLNVVLEKMGIQDVFSDERAELLGIFPHYLRVSRLIQRAEIEVNEEGTVAAAASGAAVSYKSPPPKFQADRPFLYFIVDRQSRSILFAGKITNPFTLSKQSK